MRHGTTKIVFSMLLAVVAAAAVAVAGNPGTARAAQSACGSTAAFAQFGDASPYTLMVNGSIELGGLSSFQTTGKPAVVSGNESYYLNQSTDTHALQLAPGDSVRFHATCVGLSIPTFRFVARSLGSQPGALNVQVSYPDTGGVTRVSDLGTLDATAYTGWQPTPSFSFLDGTTSLAKQAGGNVWVILTPTGSAKWQVDDLYIDPYHSK